MLNISLNLKPQQVIRKHLFVSHCYRYYTKSNAYFQHISIFFNPLGSGIVFLILLNFFNSPFKETEYLRGKKEIKIKFFTFDWAVKEWAGSGSSMMSYRGSRTHPPLWIKLAHWLMDGCHDVIGSNVLIMQWHTSYCLSQKERVIGFAYRKQKKNVYVYA